MATKLRQISARGGIGSPRSQPSVRPFQMQSPISAKREGEAGQDARNQEVADRDVADEAVDEQRDRERHKDADRARDRDQRRREARG